MAMTMGRPNGPAADMNVTPLIDVLLVLLIIFMVITPMTPTGERAAIPQPPPTGPQPPNLRSIVVEVLAGSGGEPELRINQQPVAWQELQPRLIDTFKTRAEKVLFVQADNALPWDDVVHVIGLAHAAGVDTVGLMPSKIQPAS